MVEIGKRSILPGILSAGRKPLTGHLTLVDHRRRWWPFPPFNEPSVDARFQFRALRLRSGFAQAGERIPQQLVQLRAFPFRDPYRPEDPDQHRTGTDLTMHDTNQCSVHRRRLRCVRFAQPEQFTNIPGPLIEHRVLQTGWDRMVTHGIRITVCSEAHASCRFTCEVECTHDAILSDQWLPRVG